LEAGKCVKAELHKTMWQGREVGYRHSHKIKCLQCGRQLRKTLNICVMNAQIFKAWWELWQLLQKRAVDVNPTESLGELAGEPMNGTVHDGEGEQIRRQAIDFAERKGVECEGRDAVGEPREHMNLLIADGDIPLMLSGSIGEPALHGFIVFPEVCHGRRLLPVATAGAAIQFHRLSS
jgi:hypothetical protein